jgi:small redox-active disulfide protein 2
MNIEILGPGCKKCDALGAATTTAVGELGIDAAIVKVTDYGEMAVRGVMSSPGLAIDGTVVSTGRVPSVEAIKDLLRAADDHETAAARGSAG